jgi:uncharacterized protein (TIGR01319 family)
VPEDIQFLTIEVGSTITKVNGFTLLPEGRFAPLAQGFAPTSVASGNVRLGVDQATQDLESKFKKIKGNPEIFINSSAAGGLRMTVHGLTYSMTARAAREAALGAGAIVKMVTAGLLDDLDLEEIRQINPNIILLAGGVDFGEKETVLKNAEKLASLHLPAPIVFAGNSALRKHVENIFSEAKVEMLLAANVFPEVDVLNIEPLRKVIHEVFNRHIIHASGMSYLAGLSHYGILPTPGAVLKGAELFTDSMGDCLVFDVGGATTDVHSVTDGSTEWSSKLIEPEPRAKRTVEGDLGVFINAHNIVEQVDDAAWAESLDELQAIPVTERQKELTYWLCEKAVNIGVRRHAGVVTDLYTPSGKKQIVRGKDLTAVKWIVGTGGALTRLEGGEKILQKIRTGSGKYLLPKPDTAILMDRDYRFSALGTLAQAYPEEVSATFKHWVEQEIS